MKDSYFDPDKENYLNVIHFSHSAYQLHYHIVWGTKYRKQLLKGEIRERLTRLIQEICAEKDYKLLGGHIEPEHVHLLVSLRPNQSISDFMKNIRGKTSFILREEFPQELRKGNMKGLWASGYYAHTVGFANVAQIKAYLDRQREHHRG